MFNALILFCAYKKGNTSERIALFSNYHATIIPQVRMRNHAILKIFLIFFHFLRKCTHQLRKFSRLAHSCFLARLCKFFYYFTFQLVGFAYQSYLSCILLCCLGLCVWISYRHHNTPLHINITPATAPTRTNTFPVSFRMFTVSSFTSFFTCHSSCSVLYFG